MTDMLVSPPGGSGGGVTLDAGSGITIEETSPGVYLISATGGGTVANITSPGATITVTNPDGPDVELDISGAGAGVASLSGDGVTETPGALTQSGGLTVTDAEADGVTITTNGGISITESAAGVTITETGPDGVTITDTGGGGVTLSSSLGVVLSGAGANAPALTVGNNGAINFAPNTGEASNNFNLFAFDGNPNGNVTSIAVGDLCVDTTDCQLWQSAVADSDSDWIAFFNGTPEPTYPQSFGLSPGNLASPGLIEQNGGLDVTDTEGDGIDLSTNAELILQTTSSMTLTSTGIMQLTSAGTINLQSPQNIISGNGSGTVTIGDAESGASVTTPTDSIAFPFTVVVGVNDTFTYTPISTGTPEVFTVAPGVYADEGTMATALAAATGATSGEPLDTYVNVNGFGAIFFWTAAVAGTAQNGDTLTPGPTDITAGLDIPNPTTLVGGVAGDAVTLAGKLGFFGFSGPTQQQITGELSAVTDPAAAAVLTSILAMFSAHNLAFNSTT